ncbi:MAG: hypothetical protein WC852_00045 [Candidatus Nanoarchaeia archaeon]
MGKKEQKMTNLIPMAGIGSRFLEKGFTLPKPLIPVLGLPMLIKVIRDLPPSDKWIFLVRKEHIDEYQIDAVINHELPDAIIIPVAETTEGQACTCLLAKEHINMAEPLFIAACDSGFLYDHEKFEEFKKDKNIDAVFFTFSKQNILRVNPSAWGWCILNNDGKTIKSMSIKIPISKDPYYDHAITASFFFKKAQDFFDAVSLMINEDYRINNEFYVDSVPIFLNRMGKKTAIFDVDLFVSWGTPNQLFDFQKVSYFVANNLSPKLLPEEYKPLFKLWKKYIKGVS